MSADRLDRGTVAPGSPTGHSHEAELIEKAVLGLLSGAPVEQAAASADLTIDALAGAAALYRAAGQRALQDSLDDSWLHLYIEFLDWRAADQVAQQHLRPLLSKAEDDGLISKWWFLRKHPCWRLRLLPAPAASSETKARLGHEFDRLVTSGTIVARRWGTYEAEAHAFGGAAAMDAVHTLFWHDSQEILGTHLGGANSVLGRRETAVLLCSTMLRAAGLEWYEQGDVWRRVARERPHRTDGDVTQLAKIAAELRTLVRANTESDGPLFDAAGPVSELASWAGAFRHAGRALGSAAREGSLERGLREVLSYVVLFVWNRHGLPTNLQSVLARGAGDAILGAPYLDDSAT